MTIQHGASGLKGCGFFVDLVSAMLLIRRFMKKVVTWEENEKGKETK
jgi:hypothetical protein